MQRASAARKAALRYVVILVVMVAMAASPAVAQERPGSFYVIAGIAIPTQEGVTGEMYQTYVIAPGGTTLGWTVTGGVFAHPLVSLEGQISSTGIMRAREPSRYDTTFNEERRDRFFGANARFHIRAGSLIDFEPVLGFSIVRHEGWLQTELCRDCRTGLEQLVIYPRRSLDLPPSFALTTGIDLRIGGHHLAVVPSFHFQPRLATIGDSFKLDANYPDGFPRWTVSSGIAGRIDF